MQTAGINIVANWDASAVEAGVKKMQELFKGIPALNIGTTMSGASGGMTAASNEIQKLKNEAKGAKDNLQSFLVTGSAASSQGKELAATYNGLNAQLQNINRTTKGTQDAYARLSRVANDATRWAQNLGVIYGTSSQQFVVAAGRAKALTDRLSQIDAETGRYGRNVGNYASGFNAISTNMARIVGEMPNFSQSLRLGFLSISNNIQPLAESISDLNIRNKKLAAQGKPTTSALKAVGAALFSWNTLLLVGVTALTAYGPKLIEYIRGVDESAEALKRATERKKELNQIDESAYQQAGKNIGTLNSLISVIENENTTNEAKRGILKKLQDMYPTTLGNLTMHDAASGKLAQTIRDVLIPAIEAEGRVMALNDKISNNYGKRIDLKYKQIQAEKEYTKSIQDQQKVLANPETETTQDFISVKTAEQARREREAANAISEAAQAYKNIRFETMELEKESVFLSKEQALNIGDVNKAAAAGLSGFKDTATFLGKAGKDADESKKKVKKLNDELSRTTFILGDLNIYDTLKSFRDPVDKEGQDLANTLFPDLSKEIQENAAKMGKATKDYADAVSGNNANIRKQGEADLEDMARSLERTMNNISGSIADAIGAIFSGDSYRDIFGNLLNNIGGALKEFGKYLIQIGVMKKLIDKAIASLKDQGGGVLVGVAGAAAIALGSILQSAAQKKQKSSFSAFANGGIVYGPTMGLVGEYPGASSNPEVIAPLSELKKILGGGGQKVEVTGIIKGKDLALVMERQTDYNNR